MKTISLFWARVGMYERILLGSQPTPGAVSWIRAERCQRSGLTVSRNEAGIDQNRQACALGYTGAGRCAYAYCKAAAGAGVLQTAELYQSWSDDDVTVLYCRDAGNGCGRLLKNIKAQQGTVTVEGDVGVFLHKKLGCVQ